MPGSEIKGVPASEISDIILPSFKSLMMPWVFFLSLNLWNETSWVLILKWFKSLIETRVSSQRIKSEFLRISNALIVKSPKFPIGVETK